MAMLGIPIGVSFAVGIIGGPILAGWFGTPSLFWMTGVLGLGTDFLLARYLKQRDFAAALRFAQAAAGEKTRFLGGRSGLPRRRRR